MPTALVPPCTNPIHSWPSMHSRKQAERLNQGMQLLNTMPDHMLSQSFCHHDQKHSMVQQGMHSVLLSLWAPPAHHAGSQSWACSAWQAETPQCHQLRRQLCHPPQRCAPACVDRQAHQRQPDSIVKVRCTACFRSEPLWRVPRQNLSRLPAMILAVCCALGNRFASCPQYQQQTLLAQALGQHSHPDTPSAHGETPK